MRRLGASGMPDTIRTTVDSMGARPQQSGLLVVLTIAIAGSCFFTAGPAEAAGPRFEGSTVGAYISALLLLDRDEIAALALTLGILCFAVVTAILFVRTRRRLAEVEAAARDEAIASKAAVDRAYALFLSEPQILVAWHAAADEPEIIGDPTLVSPADSSLPA